ncbi:Phosphatidylinositol 4-kinase lsb6 [Escovopsis weberi]|uniref:Phosphatidylinositol 4-kinase n=1 Tax=Escovopsis weberi TaxID=150374 RepID=A0A0M8MW42_ESCWE|nr:Phosphatidylinositol 4-kinase lsb6 [Escovopsis weberi]
MPRQRPAATGYERLAQADQFSDDSDNEFLAESTLSLPSNPRYTPANNGRGHHSNVASPKAGPSRSRFRRRAGSHGGVDIKAINARLERWAEEIASKFKRGRGRHAAADEERLEIHHSVFQPPEGVRPISAGALAEPQPGVMTKSEFEAVVESVRSAIRQEIHPSMISQGSSGSYFARDPENKIVGVFKPKDEEPYAAGNPKWNKWIHRNLFPCFFGRACLIPNLSYVSEAAAYVLDCQLRTHLVPYTDVVWLSSKSFHYPYWDRRGFYRKKKPLPPKPGSFQVFLKGFKDANVFLRENPWPDQYWSGFRSKDAQKRKKKRWTDSCRPSSAASREDATSDQDDDDDDDRDAPPDPTRFVWNEQLKQSFREELEKLVILDYIMRNTDRGLDNWMVKVDWETNSVSLASDPIQLNMEPVAEEEEPEGSRPVDAPQLPPQASRASYPYKRQKPMELSSRKDARTWPVMSIGAIDNSLSWPWKHPDAWRRDHFLPLLTSTAWWIETQMALKKVFQMDEDFQERMFAKQIAVMKGQAWNVVEALKTPDHGPLELTRRTKVCVWDDLVDVPVAVPMRVTSAEMRRASFKRPSMDEADITGSAPTSRLPPDDLLGFSSTPADMPHPGRFEIFNDDIAAASADEQSANGSSPAPQRPFRDAHPAHQRGYPASYQGGDGAPTFALHPPEDDDRRNHQRRYSYATAAARQRSSSIAQHLYGDYSSHRAHYDDDLEGDLGYAAAEGQMSHQRKVIVERIEAVKSSNPVFTWC